MDKACGLPLVDPREQGHGPDRPPTGGDDRLVSRVFVPVATRYWRGKTGLEAWGLIVILSLCVLIAIGGNVGFSMWNRWFFDALEQRSSAMLSWSLLALIAIGIVAVLNEVGLTLARETLQVRWRAWLTRELTDRWLGKERFHQLNEQRVSDASVPEYRIADDIRWATEPVMDFYIGLLGAVAAIISFAGILLVVGGSITIGAVTIPGYMVLGSIIHGLAVTGLMLWFGRTLPRNMAARNEAEAHFRLGLMRVRENAEEIAAAGEVPRRRRLIRRGLNALVQRWMTVVYQDGRLALIVKTNAIVNPIIPLLLAAPKYMDGELTLGGVMQLASAYMPMQGALCWAIDNFRLVSQWHASAFRVAGLIQSMRAIDAEAAPVQDAAGSCSGSTTVQPRPASAKSS
jgi:putative ATP-binding cassette transporter